MQERSVGPFFTLPGYPGMGSSACLTECFCKLDDSNIFKFFLVWYFYRCWALGTYFLGGLQCILFIMEMVTNLLTFRIFQFFI